MTETQKDSLVEIHERMGSGVVAALNGLEDSLSEIDKKPSSYYTNQRREEWCPPLP
jgi:hypothetical protein